MSILSDIFAWFKRIFKEILDLIKKILPYILLGIAVWLALGMPFLIPSLGISIAAGGFNALLVAGVSFVLAPGETQELISEAAEALGNAATDVIQTVVDVADSALTSVLSSSPALLIVGGLLLWFLLSREKERQPAMPNASARSELS